MATASGLGVFWKLLLLWRGSIYKLVWTNLALYIVLYYSLSLTYRFLLDPGGRVSGQYNQDIDIDIAYLIPGKVRADLSPLPEICRSDSSDICAGVLCEVKTVKKCIVDIRKIFIYCAQHRDNAVVGAVPHDPVARLLLPVHLHLHPGAR